MRIILILYAFFLTSCNLLNGQNPSKEQEREKEFQELLKKSKETQIQSQLTIQSADKAANNKITKVTKTIVTLKNEVKQLKQELNETKQKLDSIGDVDNDIKFNLLPIPGGKENR